MLNTLIGSVSEPEIRYYTTRLRLGQSDEPTRSRLEFIAACNSQLIPRLIKQNIRVVRAGMLRPRERNPCPKCGQRNVTLVEKGVDVRLALDMVTDALSPNVANLVVVSSDLDLLPAVAAVRTMGKHITYMATERTHNRAFAMHCDMAVTFSEKVIRAMLH